MKNGVLLFMLLLVWLIPVAQIKWDGGGDGIAWNDPANWLPDAVPAASDEVVLDNSIVAGNYTVILPAGAISISLRSLIITPGITTVITLLLPVSNTANPGLLVTGTGDALVLNKGAVLRNSSGASAGPGIAITDTFRINNGGRYIHNTRRANASIISQLSMAAGTESGIFEYDVPVASYTPSLSGRTYGSLVLSSLANGGTVTYIGSGAMPLTIRGDLQINSAVTLSISMSAAFIIRGNYYQSSSSTFNLQNSTNSNSIRIAGDLSGQGTITKTGTGSPVLELNGTIQQHIMVTGTIMNNVDLRLNNHAGAVLMSSLSLPYRYTIIAGNLILENFDLTTPFINQVAAPSQTTNHIVTNGSGMLIIPAVVSAIFPVGPDTNHYNPVNIVNGVNARFAIRVQPGISPGMTGIPFPAIVNRTWTINALPDPGAAASLRLGFYEGDWLNGFSTTLPVDLGKYLSGWNAVRTGLTVASGTDPHYEVPFTNMVSGYNGSFIIGNSAFGLPVNFFVTARAQKRNNAADISWSVSNAAEIRHFEVQYSVNGGDYKTIGIVSPSGNRLEYMYTDNSLLKGMSLYRVKVIYPASASAYSNTVAIMNSENVSMNRIAPNPVYDKATIFLSTDAAKAVEFILMDMNGRIVKRWKEHIAEGNATIGINLEKLPAGVYQLIGFTGGVKLSPVRIIKVQ